MSYTLLFLALLMAIVVWWLVKQTVNLRPWAANVSPEAVRSEGVRSPSTSYVMPSSKVALGVLLAVVTSLFALFISAYSIRMEYGDWRPMPEPTILWVNTFILILGSVFLQYAWNAAFLKSWTASVGTTIAALQSSCNQENSPKQRSSSRSWI